MQATVLDSNIYCILLLFNIPVLKLHTGAQPGFC